MSAKIVEEQATHAALNGHVAPHAPNGEEGEVVPMEDDGPEAAAEDGTLNWNQSYAAVASNTKTLELHLY